MRTTIVIEHDENLRTEDLKIEVPSESLTVVAIAYGCDARERTLKIEEALMGNCTDDSDEDAGLLAWEYMASAYGEE